jgi:transcriptional regulator with GAF, ATPase, and Fis domain
MATEGNGTGAGAAAESLASASGHLELLQRVTEQMTVHHRLDDVLGAITRGLVANADAALARIWLYTSEEECAVCRRAPSGDAPRVEGRSLHLCASAGSFGDISGPQHRVPLGMFLGGRVAEDRAPLLLNDLADDPRTIGLSWIAEHGLRGYVGYPLTFHDQLEGVLGIYRKRPWSVDEFRVLSIFAAQAAIAITTTRLIEAAESRGEELSNVNAYLQDELRQDHGSGEIVGRSASLLEVLRKAEKVAPTDTTVLVLGETGTGKELLARAIHARSSRRDLPLIKINCGAISPALVESELFGHEKGAFTGALQRRVGRFELADGGTLFLDEVGDLPPDVQVKLLRVLQEGEFERVGGGTPIHTDARLVAATNRDLEADVAAGRFRADLYYRLSVFPMRVPSLRERIEDVPLLAQHFLGHFERKLKKPLRALAPDSIERLTRYAWPGNIRELQNVIERACVLAQGNVVHLVDPLHVSAPDPSPAGPAPVAPAPPAAMTLEDVEREHIVRVLEMTQGVIQGPQGAAHILAIHPNTLRSRMQRLGIRRVTRPSTA